MNNKRFVVEVRSDDYDFENDCWTCDEMELLDTLHFDTFEEAKNWCNALTPMQAMKYEQEGGYNGLSIEVYEHLDDGNYVMASSYDWIGTYKVGMGTKYECGIIDIQSGYEECGVADSIFEAMTLANEIEIDFTGLPIKQWRYDSEEKEWYANSNDEFQTPWYIRTVDDTRAESWYVLDVVERKGEKWCGITEWEYLSLGKAKDIFGKIEASPSSVLGPLDCDEIEIRIWDSDDEAIAVSNIMVGKE